MTPQTSEAETREDHPLWHAYSTFYCTNCNARLVVPVYCGNRFCPVCGAKRRIRVRDRIQFLLDNAPTPPGYSLKLLTLTIPNSPDPKAGLEVCINAFRKLRARIWWKKHVSGGAYVVEIAGSSGAWHVHIHCLLISRFMPVQKLSKLWFKVSPGKIVWISKADRTAGARYLTKYLTKPDMPQDQIEEIARHLTAQRLFQPFGTWQSLQMTKVRPPCVCRSCGASSWIIVDRPHYHQCNLTRTGQIDAPLPDPPP